MEKFNVTFLWTLSKFVRKYINNYIWEQVVQIIVLSANAAKPRP
jgi:hypothetical protein